MRSLAEWTKPVIHAECSAAYGQYDRAMALQYTKYFDAHPQLRGAHRYCASNLAAALPPNSGHLERKLPPQLRHYHFRSGKSSQVLALALLGHAAEHDTRHRWLADLLGCDLGSQLEAKFEHELPRDLLGEQASPKATSIDYYVASEDLVVCVECKWTEQGIGSCSCGTRKADDADRSVGDCSARVLARSRYWEVARDIFRLPQLTFGSYCPISTPYQAIRNVAAAIALAGGRKTAFVLLYDERNPYFRGTNEWPGWPAVLASAMDGSELVRFRAASWQHLIKMLPLTDSVTQWAAEKHALLV